MFNAFPFIFISSARNTGKAGTNWPTHIVMRQGDGAVLAQEMYEQNLKAWVVLVPIILAGIAAVVGATMRPEWREAALLGFVVLSATVIITSRLPIFLYQLELNGHAVECVARSILQKRPLGDVQMEEARRLLHGYDGQFRKLGVFKLAAELNRRAPMARRYLAGGWLRRRMTIIERYARVFDL